VLLPLIYHFRGVERLELYASKGARTVLRGGGLSNGTSLPDPRESPERFVAIWGQPHWFADWEPEGDEKEQECVAKIVEIVDQAPRCDQCGGPRVHENWEYTEDGFITDKDHEKKLCQFCWAEAQERRDHDA
jgi:hypothetical protein